MTKFDHSSSHSRSTVRALALASVIVTLLLQSLLGAVHPYHHADGARRVAPGAALTADSASSAQQVFSGHDDTDETQCALCLALHASSNCVGLKAAPFIAPSRYQDCYIAHPAFRPLESRRYSIAQQRAPPISV